MRLCGLADQTVDYLEYDPEAPTVRFGGRWRDGFEAVIARSELSSRPEARCRILSGLVSGFASGVFGMEILVRELECQSAGDERCRFEGRPVEEWDTGLMEVRQYFAVTYLDEELSQTQAMIQAAEREMSRWSEEVDLLRGGADRTEAEHGIVFRSEAMAKVLHLAGKVAPTGSNVLIQGESGTGKEVLALYIHRKSGRGQRPFLAVNCAALPPNLLESELFGHVKGAFTGADSDKKGLMVEADAGTLFLDEIGEMPLELQAKLLRVLQEKSVRPVGGLKSVPLEARIVTATNQDLRRMVSEGRFREDLYYRLAVFPLFLTPLRQRRQDILVLARHFLHRLDPNHPGFSPQAVRRMEAHPWPGNVRELENWVEYAVVLAGRERIMPEHLPIPAEAAGDNPLSTLALDLPTAAELEKRYIRKVLDHTEGNKSEAARILGLSMSTLWRRMKG
jgi:transcriptional regulator with PAS, ATPase and Fis domain